MSDELQRLVDESTVVYATDVEEPDAELLCAWEEKYQELTGNK